MKTPINDILSVFCVSLDDIKSKNRKAEICDLRKIISKELREDGLTYKEIAFYINKNHSTVINCINQYDQKMSYDDTFREKVAIVEEIKDKFMKILLTLDNSKLLVLNNSMQFLDGLVMQDHPKKNRMILSLSAELRTELLLKAIKIRQKDKSFVLKMPYHKAEALLQYLQEYDIHFPDDFGSYETNAILQMISELHRQLL